MQDLNARMNMSIISPEILVKLWHLISVFQKLYDTIFVTNGSCYHVNISLNKSLLLKLCLLVFVLMKFEKFTACTEPVS